MSDLQRIEALVSKWEIATRNAFLKAVREHRDSVNVKRLAERIRAGDVEGAVREVGLDPADYRHLYNTITASYEASGTDAAAVISASRYSERRALFDARHFRAEDWARQTAGGLITDVMTDQGTMMRQALGRAVATGQNPYDAALELVGRINKTTGHREGGLIGLTSSQADWVRTYEADLSGVPNENALTRALRDRRFDRTVAKAIREGMPIPAETRQAMVNAYKNRALRYRAEQIGMAESRKAIAAAQLEAYEQAVEKGAIEADQVRRLWITMGDERVRFEHRLIPGMNKGGVGLRQAFQTPEGPAMYPPLGFGCRCRVRMEIKESRRALAA